MKIKNALNTLIGWMLPPVSYFGGGGGGGDTTSYVKADPWTGIQPYVSSAAKSLNTYASNIPSFYPGQTYAGFDPYQLQSQNMALNYANSLNPTVGNGINALNFGLNAPDVNNNPYLQGYVNAAIQPLTQAYQEQILPGIRDQAEMYGGAGSRTGLAEGVASRGYMDAIGNTTSNIMSQAYGQGLDQQARMAALMPNIMSAGMMPSSIYGDVGAMNQAMGQMGIDEAMNRYFYNQTAPYDRYSNYFSTLMGTPWNSQTTETSMDSSSNPWASALGGAAMGAGTGMLLTDLTAGAGLSAFAPWLAGGALLGGLFS